MDTGLLKYIMDKKEITKKDLATAIGVKYNAVCLRLSGKVEFRREEIQKVINLLELTDAQIIDIFFKKKSS